MQLWEPENSASLAVPERDSSLRYTLCNKALRRIAGKPETKTAAERQQETPAREANTSPWAGNSNECARVGEEISP